MVFLNNIMEGYIFKYIAKIKSVLGDKSFAFLNILLENTPVRSIRMKIIALLNYLHMNEIDVETTLRSKQYRAVHEF